MSLGAKGALNVKPIPHLSLQSDKRTILDEVDALLLRRIFETNSLTEAAKLLGISYRNAWGRIKKIESSYGKQILETKVGGQSGGSSRLTPEGMSLFKEFRRTRKYLFNALDDRESAGNVRYKLSARNVVRTRITRIERGDITSLVRMDATVPAKLTSVISNEAVDDLGLREGDEVDAVIKSTEVMIAKPLRPSPGSRAKSQRTS
jgi:molybdate transport system regulatory protein